MTDDGQQLDTIGRQILDGQIRHLLTLAGGFAIAHGIATQGEVNTVLPAATEDIVGSLLVAGPMAWSALSKIPISGRLAAAIAALRGAPYQPAPEARADPAKASPVITERTSIVKNIAHIVTAALGIVLGILIPGASTKATNDTVSIQQLLANLYGEALTALSKQLAVDTTGMSGMQKLFVLAEALVQTAIAQGWKGDVAALEAAAIDVASTAYRAIQADPEATAETLAVSLGASTGLTAVAGFAAEIVGAAISSVVSKTGATSASVAAPTGASA